MSSGSPPARPSKRLRTLLGLIKLSGTLVGLAVAGACVRAIGLEKPVRYEQVMLVGPAVLGGLVALLSWCAARPMEIVNALAVACLFALIGLETVVRATGMMPMIGDVPEYAGALREHVQRGEPVAVQWSPQNWVLSRSTLPLAGADPVLPLGGVAHRKTVIWREGNRPFWTYVADAHGFNNPQPAWPERAQVMLVGDSFTYGACVRNEDHFAHAIRQVRPRTVNVAQGGNGPLLELAAIREYVPELRPEVVFWVYDENNDLYSDRDTLRSDLEGELLHPVLRRYLEDPKFRQGLFGKAAPITRALLPIVDEYIRNLIATYDSRVLEFLSLHTLRAIVRTSGFRRYPSVRANSRASPGSLPPAADPEAARAERMATFERILRQARGEVEAAGGRLVFVNPPRRRSRSTSSSRSKRGSGPPSTRSAWIPSTSSPTS